jgi:hypothetical protein
MFSIDVRKSLVGLCGAIFLPGCATSLASYNPSNRPYEQLAYVEATGPYEQYALIVSVYDAQGKRVFGTDSWVDRDRWARIYIEEGRYRFVTFCSMMNYHAYPQIEAEVLAGQSYVITCRPQKSNALYGSAEAFIEKTDIPRPPPSP